MKKIVMIATLLALVLAMVVPVSVQADYSDACFGLVASVYGQLGIQGEHASSFAGDDRVGLYNLAGQLYDLGFLNEPTITGLGVFLHDALGLDIDACQA